MKNLRIYLSRPDHPCLGIWADKLGVSLFKMKLDNSPKVLMTAPPLEEPLFINQAITSHLSRLDYPQKSIDSLLKCGQLTGRKIMGSCSCKNRIYSVKHRCNLRTCPECSKRRKGRIVHKYRKFLKNIPQTRYAFIYMLTISPRNYKNLEYGLKDIKKNFSKFIRHKYISERMKAGLYVIETKGTEGNWNIHIHALVYGRRIDNKVRLQKDSKITRLWKQSSKSDVHMYVTKQNSSLHSLNYMAKYISSNKDEFETPKDIALYIKATYKKRLIATFGLFYKYKFKVPPYYCPHCKGKVEFTNEQRIIYEVECSPPPDIIIQQKI